MQYKSPLYFHVPLRVVAMLERNGILKIANVGDCGVRVVRKGNSMDPVVSLLCHFPGIFQFPPFICFSFQNVFVIVTR